MLRGYPLRRLALQVLLLGGALALLALVAPVGALARTAYVANDLESGTVTPIDTATNTAGTPIAVGAEPVGIAITPDAKTAYVTNLGSNNVTPIDTATNNAATPIAVGAEPFAVAITPDGKTAYVANRGPNDVTPIDTATNAAATPIAVGAVPIGVAITPNQAPIAAFAAGAVALGQATSFDASASSDPDGSIASYGWSFGDGSSATATAPLTSHTYASAGTFTATLTVTDNEGCSTTFVFTGQTASCNGSATATATRTFTVTAAPVTPITPTAPPVTPLTPAPPGGPPIVGDLLAQSKCVTHPQLLESPVSGTGGLAFSYTLNQPASVLYVLKRHDASRGHKPCRGSAGHTPGSYSEVASRAGQGSEGSNDVSLATTARAGQRYRALTHTQITRTYPGAGRHSITLGQIAAGHTLAPGTYVLMVRATNATGGKSNDAMVKFFVLTT